MKSYFQHLFTYNQWAYGLFKDLLIADDFEHKEIQKLLSHCHNAESIWMDRIKGKPPRVGVWDTYSFQECFERLKSSNQEWVKMIASAPDFDRIVTYVNSRGDHFESRLSDIIIHVANHGTHHRGQISLLLRKMNIKPPATDFILFSRA